MVSYKSRFVSYAMFFLILGSSYNVNAQNIQHIGIPSGVMDFYAANQMNSQWCWAASIQMVLNAYGVNISQQDVVSVTYGADSNGELINEPASVETIHQNLNSWGVDFNGRLYQVTARLGIGEPSAVDFVNELSNGIPIIICYKNDNGGGHAVVVTGVSTIETDSDTYLRSIIVRDPWPSVANLQNNGRVEYPLSVLQSRIYAYWYITVE